VNGSIVTLTHTTGADNGDWFGDISNLDNFTLGALIRSNVIIAPLTDNSVLGEAWYYNRALSVGEILHNYNVTKWRYL